MHSHCMALREHSQFSAMGGGLRAQFRRAERESILLQDLESAAARDKQSARMASGLRAQRLAEPAAGA